MSGALLRALTAFYFPRGKVRNRLCVISPPDVSPHESAPIEGFRTSTSSSAVAVFHPCVLRQEFGIVLRWDGL